MEEITTIRSIIEEMCRHPNVDRSELNSDCLTKIDNLNSKPYLLMANRKE